MYYTDKSLNTEKNRTIFKIVEKMFPNKRFFIVGSSLYKEDFNDIDVLILTNKKYKVERKGIFHIMYVPIKELKNSALYQSMILLSITNIKKYNNYINKEHNYFLPVEKFYEDVFQVSTYDIYNEDNLNINTFIQMYNLSENGYLLNSKEINTERKKLYKNINKFQKMFNKIVEKNYNDKKSLKYFKKQFNHLKTEGYPLKKRANLNLVFNVIKFYLKIGDYDYYDDWKNKLIKY